MGSQSRKIGQRAEELACRYLENLDYRIVAKNYQIRGGEIDIVAEDKDILVFVEVKARYTHEFGSPLEAITPWKLKSLIHTASVYINHHDLGEIAYRIDAVGIDYVEDPDNPKIELVKNITL